MAGGAKENKPSGGSLKYLFVYLKVSILKLVTVYIYMSMYTSANIDKHRLQGGDR